MAWNEESEIIEDAMLTPQDTPVITWVETIPALTVSETSDSSQTEPPE